MGPKHGTISCIIISITSLFVFLKKHNSFSKYDVWGKSREPLNVPSIFPPLLSRAVNILSRI